MIEGKAKCEFGNGDILVVPLCRKNKSKCCVVLRNSNTSGEIGESVSSVGFEILDSDTVLTFQNTSSIEVLIDALFEAKLCMKSRSSLTSTKEVYAEY